MAEFDPALVSTRSVVWNDTDRSVHYGDEYAGVLKLNDAGAYDSVVQHGGEKREGEPAATIEAGALAIARQYCLAGDDDRSTIPTPNNEDSGGRSHRYRFVAPVRADAGPEATLGRTLNMSVTGAALEIDLDTELDDEVELEIGDVIAISGQVVRISGNRIAVQFIDCNHREQLQIDRSLARALGPEKD